MVIVVEVIESKKVLDLFDVITKMTLWCVMKGKKKSSMSLRFRSKQVEGLPLTGIEKKHFKDQGGTRQVK